MSDAASEELELLQIGGIFSKVSNKENAILVKIYIKTSFINLINGMCKVAIISYQEIMKNIRCFVKIVRNIVVNNTIRFNVAHLKSMIC